MSVIPGRPKGDSDARARLVTAALSLFTRRSFQTVSTREVAREAGVDAALIRYYFGSKAGLFEHMVRETLAPVLARFRALSAEQTPEDLTGLMLSYYRAMAPNPGLPRLIIRVLQEGEGSEPYRILLSVFTEVIDLSRQWFGRALMTRDSLREGVNPDLARLSLVSLMVFPLIAPPALMRQFGLQLDPQSLELLVEHNVEVLTQGIFNTDPRSRV
ncbi:TetR/AcrR family transcriptional regulator [Shewanella salipaludis]|uniref:TetR/AcrR family transcriptional regulator n=1 Tax=Shewanella salipaludis TaxID=2723052 RepID=A0A972FXD3_9GAMM|nr:TetR/AcrR family transcriptional regulator [Shewanella salipaludis]NMH66979.1 TetR/AcrR family transcriptional regulator [Shewanella salipaludis]